MLIAHTLCQCLPVSVMPSPLPPLHPPIHPHPPTNPPPNPRPHPYPIPGVRLREATPDQIDADFAAVTAAAAMGEKGACTERRLVCLLGWSMFG